MADHLSISHYLERLGFESYQWQRDVLVTAHRGIVRGMACRDGREPSALPGPANPSRIWLGCARQSGKSEISAAIALWTAKMFPESFALIVAPAKDDARKTFAKIRRMAARDPEITTLPRDSKEELQLINNSRAVCVALERARGYSRPDVIIIDEAARVPDAEIAAIRPTATTNPHAIQMMMSTPYGKRGFFYEAMDPGSEWTKYQAIPPFCLDDRPAVIPRAESESEFRERMAAKNIRGYYSPAHRHDWLASELQMLGSHLWRQEYGFEFLDTQDQVFSSDHVDRMFLAGSEKWADDVGGESIVTADGYESEYGPIPRGL